MAKTRKFEVHKTIVSVILCRESGILALRRRRAFAEFTKYDPTNRTGVGLWELPGGTLEPGESWVDAAMRETKEETGIRIPKRSLKLAGACAYILETAKCRSYRIHIIFKARLVVRSIVKIGADAHGREHSIFRWVEDVQSLRPMISAIRRAIADLA